MARMIFVNLPVTDLPAAITFYKALGFEQNLHFSDDTAACMVWSETILGSVLDGPGSGASASGGWRLKAALRP